MRGARSIVRSLAVSANVRRYFSLGSVAGGSRNVTPRQQVAKAQAAADSGLRGSGGNGDRGSAPEAGGEQLACTNVALHARLEGRFRALSRVQRAGTPVANYFSLEDP